MISTDTAEELIRPEAGYSEAPPENPFTGSRRLGAGRAFAVFAVVVAAQIAVAFCVVIVMVIAALVRGVNVGDSAQFARFMRPAEAPLLLLSPLSSALVVYAAVRLWTPSWLSDSTATGFGGAKLSLRNVATAAVCGLAIGATYILLINFVLAPPTPAQFGPLSQFAAHGGLTRWAIIFIAVLMAPAVEEVLFRGLMLKGFAESWGLVPAGIIVTLLFVAMHALEFLRYWPAAAAILTLGLATLGVRLKTASVPASIVLHAAYNLAIVLTLLQGMITS